MTARPTVRRYYVNKPFLKKCFLRNVSEHVSMFPVTVNSVRICQVALCMQCVCVCACQLFLILITLPCLSFYADYTLGDTICLFCPTVQTPSVSLTHSYESLAYHAIVCTLSIHWPVSIIHQCGFVSALTEPVASRQP